MTVPAVLTCLKAWLKESVLLWTALLPADSNELTEILWELSFSALDRVKACEALHAQAGTFFLYDNVIVIVMIIIIDHYYNMDAWPLAVHILPAPWKLG